jgi:hypothetical protein
MTDFYPKFFKNNCPGQKKVGFGQILKPKSGLKIDLLLQRFLT